MSQTPTQFHDTVISPGLDILRLLGGPSNTPAARRVLLAIARQEGGPQFARRQVDGPARGAWQFERGGGVHGVMYHPASTHLARDLVKHYGVIWDERMIHPALEHIDGLACGFARLLLWTDPMPFPVDAGAGWQAYLRSWRPGRPHPAAWPENWRIASEVVGI